MCDTFWRSLFVGYFLRTLAMRDEVVLFFCSSGKMDAIFRSPDIYTHTRERSRNCIRGSKADGVKVLPYPVFCGFCLWKGILTNAFFEICPGVRPAVQKAIALESVDFAPPKMRGSKKRDIPLL